MRSIHLNPGNFWGTLADLPDDGEDVTIHLEGGTYLLPDDLIGSAKRYGVEKRNGGALVLSAIVPGDPTFVFDLRSYPLTSAYSDARVVLAAERVQLNGLHFQGTKTDSAHASAHRTLCWSIGATALVKVSNPAVHPIELTCVNCRWSGGYTTQLRWYPSGNPLLYTDIHFQDLVMDEIGIPANYIFGPRPNLWGYAHVKADNIKHYGRGMLSDDPTSWDGDGAGLSRNFSDFSPPVWGDFRQLSGTSTVLVTREDCLTRIYNKYNHDLHCFRYNQLDYANDRSTPSQVSIIHRDGRYRGEWKGGTITGDQGGPTNLWYYHGNALGKWTTEGERIRFDLENMIFEHIVEDGVGNLGEIDVGSGVNLNAIWMAASADYHLWDCKFYRELPSHFDGTVSYPPVDIRVTDNSGNDDGTSVWQHNSALTSIGTVTSYGSSGLYNDNETRGYEDRSWWRHNAMKKFSPSSPNYLINSTFAGSGSPWVVGAGSTNVDGYVEMTHTGSVGTTVYQDVPIWDGASDIIVYFDFQHLEGDDRSIQMTITCKEGASTLLSEFIDWRPDNDTITIGNPYAPHTTYDYPASLGWNTLKLPVTCPADTDTIQVSFINGSNLSGSVYPVTYRVRCPVLTDA